MRLGGPIDGVWSTPEQWSQAACDLGYRAVYCPLEPSATDDEVKTYARAAADSDLIIAEVGTWSNPLANDETERREAFEKCCRGLELAERIGARCCVNIAGARGVQWDGPHPENLSGETFEMIVETTRAIIDAVAPKRTFFCLETMPWIFPDSPQSYLRLLEAIDRPQFGVHLDPVNMINSPSRLFSNTEFLRECFHLLGPNIKSCHAKDIAISGQLTVHLDEVRPGLGSLDYATFLQEVDRLDKDTPLMLEHLSSPQEYSQAAEYVRDVARQAHITL